MKNIDLKTIFIFILGGLLVLSIIFNQTRKPTDDSVIKALNEKSNLLEKNNEELKKANQKLDSTLFIVKQELTLNKEKLNKTQAQLQVLKNKRNEISTNVNRLSANGIANAFTEYLDKRTKSSNDN